MLASEIIRKGKEVILERGWCQNKFEAFDGRVCMQGALNVAMYGQTCPLMLPSAAPSVRVEKAVSAAMTAAVRGTAVPYFNDHFASRTDDVIDAFDRAEKLALIAEENMA